MLPTSVERWTVVMIILHRSPTIFFLVPLVQKAGVPTGRRGELNDDVTANTKAETKGGGTSRDPSLLNTDTSCLFNESTYFVTLESVLYISFNLQEFKRSKFMGEMDLVMLTTRKSSGGFGLCGAERKQRRRISAGANIQSIQGGLSENVCLCVVSVPRESESWSFLWADKMGMWG